MFPSPWVTALLPSAKEAIQFHLNPHEAQAGTGAIPAGCCPAPPSPGWPGLAPPLGTSAELPWTAFLQRTTGFLWINCVSRKEGEEFYLPHLSPKRKVKKDQPRLLRHLYSEESQHSKKRKKNLKKGEKIQKKEMLLFLSTLLQRIEEVRAGRLATQPSQMCFAIPRPTHWDMEGELLSTETCWLPSLPSPTPSHVLSHQAHAAGAPQAMSLPGWVPGTPPLHVSSVPHPAPASLLQDWL